MLPLPVCFLSSSPCIPIVLLPAVWRVSPTPGRDLVPGHPACLHAAGPRLIHLSDLRSHFRTSRKLTILILECGATTPGPLKTRLPGQADALPEPMRVGPIHSSQPASAGGGNRRMSATLGSSESKISTGSESGPALAERGYQEPPQAVLPKIISFVVCQFSRHHSHSVLPTSYR